MKHGLLLSLFFVQFIFLQSWAQSSKMVWSFPTKGMIVGSPVLQGNTIFVGSVDSNLYAVNKSTGKLEWSYKSSGGIFSDPVATDQLVIFNNSHGAIVALQKNGKEAWVYQAGEEKAYDVWDYYLASPVEKNGTLYIGNSNGAVLALNARNGKLKWKYQTNGPVHASVAVDEQQVYIGSFDGTLYACDQASGKLNWKYKTIGDQNFPKGEIQKAPVVKNGVVYFGSRDYYVYALHAKDGSLLWNRKEPGSWVIATPAIKDNDIYFGTSDSHAFYAVNKNNGAVNWKQSFNMRIYGSGLVLDSIIYFGCFNGKLYGLNCKSGAKTFEFQTEGSKQNYSAVFGKDDQFKTGFKLYGADMKDTEKAILSLGSILSTPIAEAHTIYFGSTDGRLYAVSLK